MDGQVEAEQFGELRVRVAEHGRKVGRPVLLGVDGADRRAVAVQVAVDGGRHRRQLGDQVHRVLVDVLPVLGLVQALGIGLGEGRLAVERRDGGAELRHGVQVGREVVQHRHHVRRQVGPVGPLLRNRLDLQNNKSRQFWASTSQALVSGCPADCCRVGW